MIKRHQNILTERLESAYLNGCTYISWAELYYWYDVQKIAAGTYRDLENQWQEISDGVKGHLKKIETNGGIYVFGSNTATDVNPD